MTGQPDPSASDDKPRPPWWRRLAERHDLRLLPAAVAVWSATLLGQRLAWPWTVGGGLFAALLGLSVLAGVRGRSGPQYRDLRIAAGALIACGLAVSIFTGSRLRHDADNPLRDLAERSDPAHLRVEVTDLPHPIASPGFAGRPGGIRSVTIQAEVVRFGPAGRSRPADGSVLLVAPVRGWAGLLRGQQADLSGQFAPPRPGDSVLAVVMVRGPPRQVSPAGPVERAAQRLRGGLATASAGLPGDSRGLLPALVDGDRSGLRQPVLDDFRTAGMAYQVPS